MERLIGHRIDRILLNEDQDVLWFLADSGDRVGIKAEGDCCSRSWFESIDNVEQAIGATVTRVEELDMPQPPSRDDHDNLIQIYGVKVHTDRGYLLVEYRNSSNGYYGGYLEAAYNFDESDDWHELGPDGTDRIKAFRGLKELGPVTV